MAGGSGTCACEQVAALRHEHQGPRCALSSYRTAVVTVLYNTRKTWMFQRVHECVRHHHRSKKSCFNATTQQPRNNHATTAHYVGNDGAGLRANKLAPQGRKQTITHCQLDVSRCAHARPAHARDHEAPRKTAPNKQPRDASHRPPATHPLPQQQPHATRRHAVSAPHHHQPSACAAQGARPHKPWQPLCKHKPLTVERREQQVCSLCSTHQTCACRDTSSMHSNTLCSRRADHYGCVVQMLCVAGKLEARRATTRSSLHHASVHACRAASQRQVAGTHTHTRCARAACDCCTHTARGNTDETRAARLSSK
jgi:hypothetical protein